MPIDPTIPLMAFRPVTSAVKTPDEIQDDTNKAQYDKVRLETEQLKNDEMRQDAHDRFSMQQMLKETGGDTDKVIMRMMTVNPKLAMELREQKAKQSKAAAEAIAAQLDTFGKRIDRGIQLTQGITDPATLQQRLPLIAEISPDVADFIGPQWDEGTPQRIARAQEMGYSLKDMATQRHEAMKELSTGTPQRSLAGFLMTSRTADEWNGFIDAQEAVGIPREYQKQMKALFGEYSPENVQRAKDYWDRSAKTQASGNLPNSQSKEFLLDGKAVLGDYVPGDGGPGKYFYEGKDVTGRVKDVPPRTPAGDADASSALLNDTATIDMGARMFLKNATLPAIGVGKIAAAVKLRMLKRAGELDPDASPAVNKAIFDATKKSLSDLVGQQAAVAAFEETAVKNLKVFLDSAKSVVDSGSPLFNNPWRQIERNTLGSADQARYDTARRTVIPEFARILASPTLKGALSDSARQEVEHLIPEDSTLKQLYAVSNVLLTDVNNRKTSVADEIRHQMNELVRIGNPDKNPTGLQHQAGASGIAPKDVPEGLAKLKSSKPVVVYQKDKKTGKPVAKWTVFPDGSASKEDVK